MTRTKLIQNRTHALLAAALSLAPVAVATPSLCAQGEGMPAPSVLEPRQEAASMLDRVGAKVNPELTFTDERGYPFQLKQLVPGDRPIVLNLGYYTCPQMCGQVLHGMIDALNEVELEPGKDYAILSVSIDPRETAEMAKARKDAFLVKFTKIGAPDGWRLCVGESEPIRELTETVGYRYFWSRQLNQYAHPSALVFLTPQGTVSRVIANTVFDPKDVRLALIEASEGKLGSLWDQVQLNCLTFDATTNTYTLTAMTVMRIGGVATLAFLAFLITTMLRKERQKQRAAPAAA